MIKDDCGDYSISAILLGRDVPQVGDIVIVPIPIDMVHHTLQGIPPSRDPEVLGDEAVNWECNSTQSNTEVPTRILTTNRRLPPMDTANPPPGGDPIHFINGVPDLLPYLDRGGGIPFA